MEVERKKGAAHSQKSKVDILEDDSKTSHGRCCVVGVCIGCVVCMKGEQRIVIVGYRRRSQEKRFVKSSVV